MIYSSLCFILQNKWLEKKKRNATFFIYKEVNVSPQSKLLKKKKKLET